MFRPSRSARALSLVEALLSMALVGGLLVGALHTVGASQATRRHSADRARGHRLAEDLLSEIMQCSYTDPEAVGRLDLSQATLASFTRGPDVGEANRRDFDDADDYENWFESPPVEPDGTPLPGLADWTRHVSLTRVELTDISKASTQEEGLQQITVTVTYQGREVARLSAIKSVGLPPPGSKPALLLIVADAVNPNALDAAKQALIESWNYTVTVMSGDAVEADLQNAAANSTVVYVSESISGNSLRAKLRDTTAGVVIEDREHYDDFGLASADFWYNGGTDVNIVDNAHYITQPFVSGSLQIHTSGQIVASPDGIVSPDLRVLAKRPSGNTWILTVLEIGAAMSGGGTAPSRRVSLPWSDTFDPDLLTDDGKTMMKRAIAWAAGLDDG